MTQEQQPGVIATHSLSDGSAFGIGLELLIKPKLGIELVGVFGVFDTDLRIGTLTATGELPAEIFMLGLVYHFAPEKRADYYVAHSSPRATLTT